MNDREISTGNILAPREKRRSAGISLISLRFALSGHPTSVFAGSKFMPEF